MSGLLSGVAACRKTGLECFVSDRRVAPGPFLGPSRWRRVLLAVVALAAVAAPVSAADEPDPFPLGACVRATVVDPQPVCVMVDPAP